MTPPKYATATGRRDEPPAGVVPPGHMPAEYFDAAAAMDDRLNAALAAQSDAAVRGVRERFLARVAASRASAAAENARMQELMGKNGDGTITPAEYAELVRIVAFFDDFQEEADADCVAEFRAATAGPTVPS